VSAIHTQPKKDRSVLLCRVGHRQRTWSRSRLASCKAYVPIHRTCSSYELAIHTASAAPVTRQSSSPPEVPPLHDVHVIIMSPLLVLVVV